MARLAELGVRESRCAARHLALVPATEHRRAVRADQDAAARDAARHRSSSTRARSWACRRSRCRSSSCRTRKRSPTGRRRLSRDGARTPMPWRSDASAARVFRRRAMASGRQEPIASCRRRPPGGRARTRCCQFTRECLDLRHAHEPCVTGSMTRDDGRRPDARVRARDRIARRCAACSTCRTGRSNLEPTGKAIIAHRHLDGGMLGAYSAVVEEIA